jgi:uncharacterized protein YqgQ
MSTLYELTDELAAAQRDLTEMLDNGVISAEEYDDSLAILLDEYEVKTVGVIAHIKNLSAQVAMYKAEIAKLNARLKSTSNSLEFYNGYLLAQMIKTGQSEAGEGVHTAKIKQGSMRCKIIDLRYIPDKFIEKVRTEKIDKRAITAAINAGETVEGAEMVRGEPSIKLA